MISSLFQTIDLTTRKMLFEGPLTWRVTKEKAIGNYCFPAEISLPLSLKQSTNQSTTLYLLCLCAFADVHCVLLSDLLVLMQKQDDKMVLKCQSKSNIAVQEGKQMLSPIIKLQSVFLRDVATGQ